MKRFLAILLVLAFLALSACTPANNGPDPTAAPASEAPATEEPENPGYEEYTLPRTATVFRMSL